MIDTVKIKILGATIMKPENFEPEYKIRKYEDLSDTERKSKRHKLNQFIHKKENIKGIYMPRIEIYEKLDKENKKVYSDISIEFSVPKIIHENNLVEIKECDLDVVVDKLIHKLKTAGVLVFSSLILNSTIVHIHFGKNIILTKDITIKNIIDEMKTANMGKPYDSTYRMFKIKNNDEIFYFHSSTRQFVIYDKVRDILNKKYKSHDKEKTDKEKSIVMENNLENTEILRYEYRLKNHQTIRSQINGFLKKDTKKKVLFRDVFNEDLWRSILNKSWSEIMDRDENQLSFKFDNENPENMVRALLNKVKGSSGHDLNNILIAVGLGYIADKDGLKFFRKECSRVFSKRTCNDRLSKKIKKSSELFASLSHPDCLSFASKKMSEFKRITPLVLSMRV